MNNSELGYATDSIFQNKRNRVGIEFCPNCIRIDWVMTTGYKSFSKMMDGLVNQAFQLGYNKLFFADSLTEEILIMFTRYGFIEREVCGDPYNHYLFYFLNEGGDSS